MQEPLFEHAKNPGKEAESAKRDVNMADRIPFVSLFSGAMGLDLGLEQAGFTTIVANEINAAAIATIELNKPRLPVVSDSVTELNKTRLSTAAGRD